MLNDRYNPPVRKVAWRAEADLSADALAAEVMQRAGIDAAQLADLLWHGGLFVGKQRTHRLQAVPADSELRAYFFARPPEVVRLDPAAILFDADGIVAVTKPAWLTVQGTRASVRSSLEEQLKTHLGCDWLTPAHRLDRETSGVNLFARDPSTAELLCRQFRTQAARKVYFAWVASRPEASWPPPAEFVVQGDIVQVPHPRHARFALAARGTPGGRPSETQFRLCRVQGRRALLEARPRTGRTHQIRVHAASCGWPIVGDALYGETSKDSLKLHAASLCVTTADGQLHDFVAPFPTSFDA